MLKKACEHYGIELAFRRVKSPWYGGDIERLLGLRQRDPRDRRNDVFKSAGARSYPSEKKAALYAQRL
jgi:hypothetical protein